MSWALAVFFFVRAGRDAGGTKAGVVVGRVSPSWGFICGEIFLRKSRRDASGTIE
jgi:hypothetical protein